MHLFESYGTVAPFLLTFIHWGYGNNVIEACVNNTVEQDGNNTVEAGGNKEVEGYGNNAVPIPPLIAYSISGRSLPPPPDWLPTVSKIGNWYVRGSFTSE